MNKKTNKIGRPKAITSDVLQKLEYGFMKGLTDRQCCDFADIAQQTLYNYCKEHPAFLERKERLKNNPTVKAKINVVEEIEKGNIDLSKWYLERKEKKEFSLKQEYEVTGEINNPFKDLTTEELKKLIADEQ